MSDDQLSNVDRQKNLKTSRFNYIGGSAVTSSPLLSTLHGVKKSLVSTIGLKKIFFITHNNQKIVAKKEAGSQYPYAFIRLQEVRTIKDRMPIKHIRRQGSSVQATIAREITIDKGFLFPTDLVCELTFVSDDILETFKFVEKFGILLASDALSFTLDLPGTSPFVVSMLSENDSISLPQIEIDAEENPGGLDIVIPITIRTNLGIVKQVAKINNEGHVDSSIGLRED